MKWGMLTLLEISHSRGCYLKFAVLLVQRVCSPKRPNTKDPGLCAPEAYIAGDTLRHQPMGAGHVTMPQLHGPMGLHVLQWCHPMLACIKRTSYCTRMITLYGARKVDSGPRILQMWIQFGITQLIELSIAITDQVKVAYMQCELIWYRRPWSKCLCITEKASKP